MDDQRRQQDPHSPSGNNRDATGWRRSGGGGGCDGQVHSPRGFNIGTKGQIQEADSSLLCLCLTACTTKGPTTLHALISQFYIVPGLSSASSSRCTVAYRSVTAGGKRGRGAYSQPAKEHRCHRCDATTHTWGF